MSISISIRAGTPAGYELINYWTKCVPYAAATVWRIVVCTFGRFTAGHIQAHACVPIEYYA